MSHFEMQWGVATSTRAVVLPAAPPATVPAPAAAAEYLRLVVRLVDGARHVFVQTRLPAIQTVLQQLRPARLFAQEHVILAGTESAHVFPAAAIERLDLELDFRPIYRRFPGVLRVKEIAEEDYHDLREGRRPRNGRERALCVEMRSGATYYLQVCPDPARLSELEPLLTAGDTTRFLAHLFSGPPLFGETADGAGLFVLNPSNAVRFTLCPPPPHAVAGAWPLEHVTDAEAPTGRRRLGDAMSL